MEEIILNQWKVLDKIDSGSFARVYKVTGDNNNIYAIKKISLPLSDDLLLDFLRSGYLSRQEMNDYALSQIQKEISILEKFKDNENIIKLYEVKEENTLSGKNYYLRMEYATEIKKHFSNNNFTDEEIIKMSIDICTALEALEKNNIVHTDIKPGNIFIVNDKYKLGDFGSSVEINKEAPITIFGTMNYMAPEVYNKQKVDFSTDVYSLGLVMYSLLNGNLPFVSSTTPSNAAFEKRMNGEVIPVIFGVKEKLMNIITKACSYEKENRYKNASEMKEALINVNSNVDVKVGENESAKKKIIGMFSQPVQKEIKQEPVNNFTPIENEPTISIYDTELLNISKKNAVEINTKKKRKFNIFKNYKLRKYASLVLLILLIPTGIYANYAKNKTCDEGYINIAGKCLKGRYTCPEDYTLNKDNKCQKVKTTQEAKITRKCIDDEHYLYDSESNLCKPNLNTIKAPMTRPTCGTSGAKYNNSTGKCEMVIPSPAIAKPYCKNGYTLTGNQCIKSNIKELDPVKATKIITCPSGYNKNDTTCTKQTTVKKSIKSYTCNEGGSLVDNNIKCLLTAQRKCIKYKTNTIMWWIPGECETYGCDDDTKYVYNQTTQRCEYKYSSTPTCESGFSLNASKTECEKTEKDVKAATVTFKCADSNYELLGDICIKKDIEVETVAASISYVCAQGRLGNDNKCYVTQSANPGIEPYCQSGYEMSGTMCVMKDVKEHPPVVKYKCSRTYTLNEGKCEAYTYKQAIPEID